MSDAPHTPAVQPATVQSPEAKSPEAPSLRRIVIAGNGIAGLTAAETLHELGFTGEITILAAERIAPYSRPALSKSALVERGEMTAQLLPDADHRAEERFGVAAVGVDPVAQLVQTSSGDPLPYDGLIIATGSHAVRLSDSPNELTLRTHEDAELLRQRVAALTASSLPGTPPHVVVLGGGPLGMEIASGCRELGCEVTLVCHSSPMHALLGPVLGGALHDAAVAAGVQVLHSPAQRIDDATDAEARVTLADGTMLSAPLVVSAVGDRANTGWLSDTGWLSGGSLRIDEQCRVVSAHDKPVAHVVAAGDVTTRSVAGVWRRTPLWTDAIEQAKVAATTLLRGADAPRLAFQPYFWTDQFGINVKVCGPLPLEGEPELVDGALDDRRALLRWVHADGTATAVAYNYRMPISRLRKLTERVPAEAA